MDEHFIKDMVKYSPAQIVPGIVGFVSIPIITRLFSPQDYGNYSLAIAAVMVLTTLLGWVPVSIIRF
jgi:O-antigen/teichoic acid export membrane protein